MPSAALSAPIEHDSEHNRNEFLVVPLRNDANLTGTHGKFVTRRLDELTLHPSYVRHRLTVPASELTILIELGDYAFRGPLVITADGVIIDGYSRCELARLHDFNRILLALELEPGLREKAGW